MLSNEEKNKIVTRILEQSTFMKSPTSSNLLQYLVDATEKGIDLKESTIGVDMLGKKFDPEKGNARIRVSIYHLRKKLETYYEEAGKDDPWQIVINKGQYRVNFIQNTPGTSSWGKKDYWLLGLSVFLLISWIGFGLSNLTPAKPPFWRTFFDNNKPTTLFIGDVFGVMGHTETGQWGWMRDYKINNLNDFYAFCESNPKMKDKLKPANYHYSTEMTAYSTKTISNLFYPYHKEFSIRFSTSSNYSDIKEGNAIYVGPIKNNNKFIHFFNEGSSHFRIEKSNLYFDGDINYPESVYQLATEGRESEYAIVSRINGPDNSAQMLFFSDHDIGVKATVEYFTNPDSIKAFSNRYFEGEDVLFTALFQARGKDRINMRLEPIIVSVNEKK